MKTNLKIKTILFSMLITLVAFTGCKKDEDKEPSKTDLLVKEWNVISIDGSGEFDDFDALELKFEANGNLTVKATEGSASFSQNAKWSWGTNETTINIVIESDQLVWKLDKLTADALWFYDEDESYFKLEPKK
jgi:hypothetical protein